MRISVKVRKQISRPAIDIVLPNIVAHAQHPLRFLIFGHIESLQNGVGHLLHIVRIDQLARR